MPFQDFEFRAAFSTCVVERKCGAKFKILIAEVKEFLLDATSLIQIPIIAYVAAVTSVTSVISHKS
jgi:hypothetical protein